MTIALKYVRLYRTAAGWQWEARSRNNRTVGSATVAHKFKWTAKRHIRSKYGDDVKIIVDERNGD